MMVWSNVKKVTLGGMFVGAMMLASSLTVTGCLTDDKKDKDTIPTVTDSLKSANFEMGAQDNATLGSFVDVDNEFDVMLSSDAKIFAGDVDFIFAYSGTAKAASVYSPKTARDGVGGTPGFDFLKTGFTGLVATEIKSVDATKLAAAKSQGELDALHAAGAAAPDGRLPISNGTAFTVKSTEGVVYGVTVNTLSVTSGTESKASVTMKGMGKW
jgi:hypothetical protein